MSWCSFTVICEKERKERKTVFKQPINEVSRNAEWILYAFEFLVMESHTIIKILFHCW
jgi:hypothetical protein